MQWLFYQLYLTLAAFTVENLKSACIHTAGNPQWLSGKESTCNAGDTPDLSPTNYRFFKYLDNFLQGKCFHNQQETENAFQEFVKSQSTGF